MNLIAQRRLGAEKATQIARRQTEELAIPQSHHIGVAAIGDQQRELAEKIAGAELHGGRRDPYFDRTGRNEIHRIAALALVDYDLVRDRKARPQQPGNRAPNLRVEGREHRHATDEIFSLQPEIEGWPHLDAAPARPQLPLQILVNFLIDDRFSAQPPITLLFEPCRHACQDLNFELACIGGVLQFQRRDRAFDGAKSKIELGRHHCARPGAENLLDLVPVERDDILQDEAGGQLHLEPVGELPGERAGDTDPVVDRQRQAQSWRKTADARGRLLITLNAVAACPVPQPRRMSKQARGDAPRYGSTLEIVETEFLLAIDQDRQGSPLPELGRNLGVLYADVGWITAIRIVNLGDLGGDLGRDLMLATYGFDLLRDRGKRQTDHPLAERNFRRRHAAYLEEAHQRPHCRGRHQQGKQDKPGGEYPDELTDLRRKRHIFCGGEGERERN